MVQLIYFMFICIAAPLLLMLFLLEKQSRVTMTYMILGCVMCILAGEVNAILIGALELDYFYATITMTPIVEEILKALPVLFFAFVIDDKRERLLALAMAVGIGFAVLENVNIISQNLERVDLAIALIRGFATGLMHGICTAAVGYGISYVKKRKKLFITGTFALLIAAMIYHGIYNALVQSPLENVGYFLPILTYIPIVIYLYRQKKKKSKKAKK